MQQNKSSLLMIAGALVVCVLAAVGALSLAEPEVGFDTPQAAAQALFAALQTQEEGALAACIAFDEMGERFRFEGYTARLKGTTLFTMLLPTASPANIQYNQSLLRYRWYQRLSYTNMLLNHPEFADVLGGNFVRNDDARFADVCATLADPVNPFAQLTLVEVLTPQQIPALGKLYTSANGQETLAKVAACWDVEQYQELALRLRGQPAEASAGAGDVVLPMALVQLEGRWFVSPESPLTSAMLGISSYQLVGTYE